MALQCDVLAKPLGVFRIFLLVLGILSLVSLFDFKGSFEFVQTCPAAEAEIHQATIEWKYPFTLTSEMIPLILCNQTIHEPVDQPVFYINFHSQAKFFGFMAGTSAFLSALWLIVYVSCWFHYTYDLSLTTLDIAISTVIGLLWLCADCAWASAFMTLKAATSLQQLQRTVNGYSACRNGAECEVAEIKEEYPRGGFALTVGFCNCFLSFAVAVLAYRERSRLTIERRGLMGVTRSQAQAQAQAARAQSAARVGATTAQAGFVDPAF